MDDTTAIQDLFDGKSKVTVWPARFVGIDGGGVLCDISNGDVTGRVPAQVWTSYRPEVGESVTVVAVDGSFYLAGPATLKPAEGTITAVASDSVAVDTDIGSVTASINNGATLSAGQVVKLYWSNGAHVLGALTAAPVPPPPPDPPQPSKSQHVDTFTAVDAGTFSGGRWWQPQVWASDSTLGAWFYGSKLSDTLRSAEVTKLEIYVSFASKFGAPPNVGTHPDAGKPAGGPSISNAQPMNLQNGWNELPLAWGVALAQNGGGIGFAHGGFNKAHSLAEDALSGALRFTSTY